MLRGLLSRPSKSSCEKMRLFRERVAGALSTLEAAEESLPALAELQQLREFLDDLARKNEAAKQKAAAAKAAANHQYAPPPAATSSSEAPLPTGGKQSRAEEENASGAAGASSMLSILTKRPRAGSAEEEVAGSLASVMYVHGDAREPSAGAVEELLSHVAAWLSRVLPLVRRPEGGIAFERLVELFPLEAARHASLLAAARKQASADAESDPSSSHALLGDEVEEREASDDAGAEPEAADEAAGAGGEAVAAVAGSNESERRRFADERTGRMDLAEYDKYHARRRASGLGTGAFQRWCCGRWGLGGGGGRVSKAFSLLGWLARMRAAEVVEEANRAAHGGALTEVREGAPLSRERYAAAARAASELGVGRDDNPSGAAARSAVRVGEDDGGAQGGPRPL